MDNSPPGSSVHGDSLGKNTGVGCHALPPGDLPNPGIEHRSPTWQADSLLSEPPRKPTYGKANIGPALEVNEILILSSVSLCIAGVTLMANRHEYRTTLRWDVSVQSMLTLTLFHVSFLIQSSS